MIKLKVYADGKTLIYSKENKFAFIFDGSKKAIPKKIELNYKVIVCATHEDKDHTGCLKANYDGYNVKKIYTTSDRFIEGREDLFEIISGNSCTLISLEDIKLTYFSVAHDKKTKSSVIYIVETMKSIVIISGDCTYAALKKVINPLELSNKEITLFIPHHGIGDCGNFFDNFPIPKNIIIPNKPKKDLDTNTIKKLKTLKSTNIYNLVNIGFTKINGHKKGIKI